jgi:uncharacterized membrane protein YfcA
MVDNTSSVPAAARHPALGLYLVVGLVGGFLSGLAGIGGGVVLIPLMVGLVGVSQHQAHGTSLAVIVPTALVSASQYFGGQTPGRPPPMDLALAYCVTAVVGAPLGARLISRVNPQQLRKLFGMLLLSLASRLLAPNGYELVGNGLLLGLLALSAGTLAAAWRGGTLRDAR